MRSRNTPRRAGDAPLPAFGGRNGLLYPLTALVLTAAVRLSVPLRLALSPTATDAYLVACAAAGAAAVGWAGAAPAGHGSLWAVLAFAAWRLAEQSAITLYEFCVGPYRGAGHAPARRVLVIKLLTLCDMVVLFGGCYLLPQKFGAGWLSRPFDSALDAVYFSALTGTTVGYGDYTPTHPALKALVVYQVLFFVLVGVGIVAVLRARIPDRDGDEHRLDARPP